MKLLLWTKDDPASGRIAGSLVRLGHFAAGEAAPGVRVDERAGAALAEVQGSLLSADHAERPVGHTTGLRFDRCLFLSKHSAASGIPSLTVHPIGNLTGEAKFGGAPRTLAPDDPGEATRLLSALSQEARELEVGVTFEATHHGPVMELPSLFVEVGSRPEDWQREALALAVARAVSRSYLSPAGTQPFQGALGVGGGHYQPFPTDVARREGVPVGHMIPSHVLEREGDGAIRRAAECSKATSVLFDSRKMDREARASYLRFFEERQLEVREYGHW